MDFQLYSIIVREHINGFIAFIADDDSIVGRGADEWAAMRNLIALLEADAHHSMKPSQERTQPLTWYDPKKDNRK